MLIHIQRDGEQFGPYTLEDLNTYLAQGTLLPTDLAWWDGAPGWVSMSEVPGVAIHGVVATNATAPLSKAGGWKKPAIIIPTVVGVLGVAVGAMVFFNGNDNKKNDSKPSIENASGKKKQGTNAKIGGGSDQVFAKTVEPIFRKNRCFECHNSKESKKAKADLDFSIPSSLRAFVSPNQKGNPATTPLILAITPGAAEPMPPNGPSVSYADVELIKQWIAAGAKF